MIVAIGLLVIEEMCLIYLNSLFFKDLLLCFVNKWGNRRCILKLFIDMFKFWVMFFSEVLFSLK